MMFKNSFRLLLSNFDKVWKLLVYQILSWAVVLALLAPFYQTLIGGLTNAWELSNLGKYLTNGTFYGINVADALLAFSNAVLSFAKLLFVEHLFVGVYCTVILFFVRPFFANIGKYVVCEMVYGYMSSSSKHGFTITLLRTLKRSLPYAIFKTLYCLPFDALILASLFGLTSIDHALYAYAMPFLVVIVPSLLFALRETFSCGWAPAMIVFDQNVFRAFPKGIVASFRRGLRVYSTAFMIYLLALVLTMVIGLYALILILPCIFPFIDIFEMVMFFSSQGMRFYVDADTILSPKKLEEVDRIKDAKYLL